jgi:hypothetical protein
MIEQGTGSLATFVGWPLLPLRGDRLGLLNPLDSSTAIRPCTGAEWPSALLDAIETLGCGYEHLQLCLVDCGACHGTVTWSIIAEVHIHGELTFTANIMT